MKLDTDTATLSELFDTYFYLEQALCICHQYPKDWRELHLVDRREFYWKFGKASDGEIQAVWFAEVPPTPTFILDNQGNYWRYELFSDERTPQSIFRGGEFTLVAVDPGEDANRFLAVFSNDRELTDEVAADDFV